MRSRLFPALVAAVVLALAGCGDGDGEATTSGSGPDTDPVTSEAQEAPDAPDAPDAGPGPVEIAGEMVLLEPVPYQEDVADPGVVRDRAGLDALLDRFELGPPDPDLAGRLDGGDEVFVAGIVGGGCELPTDVTVRRAGDDLVLVERNERPGPDPDCDAVSQGLVLVAVAAAAVDDVHEGSDPS